ncbi:MAG: T9SS type A sorting domain-containing protein [Bacteroidales bacterium]|nr:T9SS type A sorting domain-containing protein [Bacteroidales bacterium]
MKRNFFIILIFLFTGRMNGLYAQWTISYLDESKCECSGSIKFKNGTYGLYMDDCSTVLITLDTGATWQNIKMGFDMKVKDFQFIGDSAVFAVGDNYPASLDNLTGRIIKSENLGKNWDSFAIFQGKQLHTLYFCNNDTGIIAGDSGIYRTINSGSSWDTVWTMTEAGYKYGSVKQLIFMAKTGFAIGTGSNQHNNPIFDYFLLKSDDYGLTWVTEKTFQYPLNDIYFLNEDTGFIATESASTIILKTIDGGSTWNEIQVSQYFNSVNSIHFSSDNIGFAAGAPSAFIPEAPTSFFIAKTANGGDTWESLDTTGIPLNSIYYINDSIGFVTGRFNLIMKSAGNIAGLPEDYPWYLAGAGDYIENDEYDKSPIKIFPNPSDGIIYVQLNNPEIKIKSIDIVSITGQITEIASQLQDNNLITLDLSYLSPGIYLLRINCPNRFESVRVIKKCIPGETR